MENRKRTMLIRERIGGSSDVGEQLELQRPDQLPEMRQDCSPSMSAISGVITGVRIINPGAQSRRSRTNARLNSTTGVLLLPSIGQSRYPFRGVKLNRADVEWLLASHESGQGPIEWTPDVRYKAHLGIGSAGCRSAQGAPGWIAARVYAWRAQLGGMVTCDRCAARGSRGAPGRCRSAGSAPGGCRSLRCAPGGCRSAGCAPGGCRTSAVRTWRVPISAVRTWRVPTSAVRI